MAENVNGHGKQLLDNGTRTLLRRMGSKDATTLSRMRDNYGSNGSRFTSMAYYVDGLERTIKALEAPVIGIRFYDTVSPLHCSSGPVCVSRIISRQGNDDRPVDDEVPTYGNHENVLETTRT